ncbi:hypothetical protein Pcinc_006751 [Petrolisthes cinctipes]|uniref:Uncharacterized protein n=1 Tax=Petrolisthes cinctipes TaxID=88211 RepID=A0AAE1KY05_PETCI|nr:hypothetical protein Pcinc_006751 [Petrolisthes cinctipes]
MHTLLAHIASTAAQEMRQAASTMLVASGCRVLVPPRSALSPARQALPSSAGAILCDGYSESEELRSPESSQSTVCGLRRSYQYLSQNKNVRKFVCVCCGICGRPRGYRGYVFQSPGYLGLTFKTDEANTRPGFKFSIEYQPSPCHQGPPGSRVKLDYLNVYTYYRRVCIRDWVLVNVESQIDFPPESSYMFCGKKQEDDSEVQNTVGAELRKNRGTSFCNICSVFLTHHKKIQPLLKLLLLEELNNLNFIVPIAALSLRIPPSKPSC